MDPVTSIIASVITGALVGGVTAYGTLRAVQTDVGWLKSTVERHERDIRSVRARLTAHVRDGD